MKKVTFSSHDFGMFDGEFNGYDYEFFYKHTGAFKRFLKEETKEQKQNFLDSFCDFFQNHCEMKAISTVKDNKKRFVDGFKLYAFDNFVNGKPSVARQFLHDTVAVAKNKHMIQYMDSQSYTKDPFFNRETRDVFRRLFGEPSESGTCVKVICLLPLHIKFAGAICRYLRRWLEADEISTTLALKASSSKLLKSKKKDEEKKLKADEKKRKEDEKKGKELNEKKGKEDEKKGKEDEKKGKEDEKKVKEDEKKRKEEEEKKGKEDENKGKEEEKKGKEDEKKVKEDEKKRKEEEEEEKKGKEDENKGKEDENKGKEDEKGGKEDEKKVKEDEKKRKEDENKGKEDENKGKEDEKKGKEYERKRKEDEKKRKEDDNEGKEDEKKGKEDEKIGKEDEKKRNDDDNKGKEDEKGKEDGKKEKEDDKEGNEDDKEGKEDEKNGKEDEKKGKEDEKKGIEDEKKGKEDKKKGKEDEKAKEEKSKEESKKNDTPAVMLFKIDTNGGGMEELKTTLSSNDLLEKVKGSVYREKPISWPPIGRKSTRLDKFMSSHDDFTQQMHRRRGEQMFNNHDHDHFMHQEMKRIKQEKIKESLRVDPNMTGTRLVVIGGMNSDEMSQRDTSEDMSKSKISNEKTSVPAAGKPSKEEKYLGDNSKGKSCEEVHVAVQTETSEEKELKEESLDVKTFEENTSKHVMCEACEVKAAEKQKSQPSISNDQEIVDSKKPDVEIREGKITEENRPDEKQLSKDESMDEESDDDNAEEDRLINEKFPELLLGEPHPNQIYDNMVRDKKRRKKLRINSEIDKLHMCAFCKTMEFEPKTFKKCQKCEGKGTKFYCSRSCQKNDWSTHRLQHAN